MSEIKHCSCTHEYQDARYGKGNRVHNTSAKDSSGHYKIRCTVCGTQKDGGRK